MVSLLIWYSAGKHCSDAGILLDCCGEERTEHEDLKINHLIYVPSITSGHEL